MTPADFLQVKAAIGLSQTQFAKFAGVNARTIRRWEKGERAIPGPLIRLLGLLSTMEDIDIREFIGACLREA